MLGHQEKLTVQKLKQELVTSKEELEEASRSVTELNKEL